MRASEAHPEACDDLVEDQRDVEVGRHFAHPLKEARLRLEGLVETRREGKTIYYSIADPRVRQMIGLLYEMFCENKKSC